MNTIGGGSAAASAFGAGSGQLMLTGATLVYVGAGETASRLIIPSVSTSIEASGSGPLVLTNLQNAVAVGKTLTLRGTSNDANTISSSLADNGGILTVTKSDGGTWFLTGANTFTGNLQTQGWLGVTASSIGSGATSQLGFGEVQLTNGGILATNPAGLTVNNTLHFLNGATGMFSGSNINLAGSILIQVGANNQIITNAGPGTLTFSGTITSNKAAIQDVTLVGPGNFIYNTSIIGVNGGAGFIRTVINTTGTVMFNNSAAVNTQGILLNQGTVIINAAQPFAGEP